MSVTLGNHVWEDQIKMDVRNTLKIRKHYLVLLRFIQCSVLLGGLIKSLEFSQKHTQDTHARTRTHIHFHSFRTPKGVWTVQREK